ncbi:MAG: S8 family serine peptidase [Sedimentisphaerales bacterium]|nr:S8 family serine peptidase [Sedimentisphaerales bacterium]
MAGISKKPLNLGLAAFFIVLSLSVCSISNAQTPANKTTYQPRGLERTGVYALRQMEPTLTGENVRFSIICRSFTYINDEPQNDYRPAVEHNCFRDKNINFHDQGELPAGISPHSTAVCSILFGEDPNAFHPQVGQFYYQGTTPRAQIDIYEFRYFLINKLNSDTPLSADIIAADFGYPFEEWWTRGIEALAEHYGTIVVAGIGNGSDASDSVLYPAAGSNVIGVGLVNSVSSQNLEINLANFALAYPTHSSIGPTGDGRCKPDIIAPGNCLAADVNSLNQYEPTGNWSSFSTPIVAGTIGLLVQKARQEPELDIAVSPDGGNCVIKAILLNSATKLPYWHKGRLQTDDDHIVPLDYIQGAGMLNAVGAYEHLVAGIQKPGDVTTTGWDLNRMDENDSTDKIYKIKIEEPADKYITATLVWNKHYSSKYPFVSLPEKDSNLRLELWAVDSNVPENSYMLDYSDSIVDNVEHIHTLTDSNYRDYEIILSISNANEKIQNSQTQKYSLAWNVSPRSNSDDILWYDLNADGIVNDADLTIMLTNLLDSSKSSESYLFGDINPDGVINVNDLKALWDHNNLQADWQNIQ